MPRNESGSSSPVRKSWTKPRLARMRDDARMSWLPRDGVGSSLRGTVSAAGGAEQLSTYSRMKNGFRDSTTDSLCWR